MLATPPVDFSGEGSDLSDGIDARGVEPRLCVGVEEVPRHAELPVAGVDEGRHGRRLPRRGALQQRVTSGCDSHALRTHRNDALLVGTHRC